MALALLSFLPYFSVQGDSDIKPFYFQSVLFLVLCASGFSPSESTKNQLRDVKIIPVLCNFAQSLCPLPHTSKVETVQELRSSALPSSRPLGLL